MPTPENAEKIKYLSRYIPLSGRINRMLEEQYRWKCLAMVDGVKTTKCYQNKGSDKQ